MGWVADYPSIDNFLFPLFQSKQAKTGSFTFYANTEVDNLLTKARATVDENARYALYQQIESIVMKDAPVDVLYWYNNPRITTSRMGGFLYNAVGFVDMWKLWVK
jgi:peptide/nickel transport system substrate-binding protein/oligopeptide transport system substrate-binding protein